MAETADVRPGAGMSRVHWDEQVIAEHDKERGTRQKIDEPDTPFVRSPQTASDNEEQPEQSLARVAAEAPVEGGAGAVFVPIPKAGAAVPEGVVDPAKPTSPTADVNPEALASRLDHWVRSGATQRMPRQESGGASSDGHAADVELSRQSSASSSRSSCEARHRQPRALRPPGGGGQGSKDRHIAVSQEEAPSPKPASASFKAKRAQHYNEVAALRAFNRPRKGSNSSSADSNTSDEEALSRRRKPAAASAAPGGCQSRGAAGQDWAEQKGASSDEAQQSRSQPSRAAGGARFAQFGGDAVHGTEPPPNSPIKQREAAGESASPESSPDWRSKRQAHYSEMAAALRRTKLPSEDEEGSSEAS